MADPSKTPIYQRRRRALERQVARLERRQAILFARSARLAQIRLLVFLIALALAGATFFWGGPWPGLLSLPVLAFGFGLAVRAHQQVERSILRHQILRQLKADHLARMSLDWANLPPAVFGRSEGDHPFARDLDLTGHRSLHHLLDSCVSLAGSDRLRAWLLANHPTPATIHQRQAMVRHLTPLFHFRDRLGLNGRLAASGAGGNWGSQRLLAWLKSDHEPDSLRPLLLLSWLLVPVNLILFGLHLGAGWPPYWLGSLAVYAALQLLAWQQSGALFENAQILRNGLVRLQGVFRWLERYPLQRQPRLAELCRPFKDPDQRPSIQLKRATHLLAAAGLAQNPFIGLALNIVVPWNLTLTALLHRFRRDMADRLPRWLDIWAEIEALSALAGFAYLNPDYTFPEIVETDAEKVTGPLSTAQNLGHPLIPRPEKVCNDFQADGLGRVVIITGSNMAGKSSFLRTLGVNLRLAYCGGPVDAQTCRTIPFRLFSALSVSDSVADGISYFYAEVKRLKRLLDELGQPDPLPLFYLIDEIFRGTNNRERFIGSRSYIRVLVGQHGFGLIATHDLALVNLADDTPQINNFHFRETVADGRMVFDYRLRPGPCPTTNALTIMRMEGLPVEE